MKAKTIGPGRRPARVLKRPASSISVTRANDDDEVIELVPSLLKLKSILVPTDFSTESKKALQYAIPFARQFNAEIILLNVVQPHYVSGDFGAVNFPVLEADAQQSSAQELAAFAAKGVRGLAPIKTVVRTGSPVDEIVAAAKELKADLIIISTHGRTGLKHVLLGSVAENVVRHAPCPVLIVRVHEREFLELKF